MMSDEYPDASAEHSYGATGKPASSRPEQLPQANAESDRRIVRPDPCAGANSTADEIAEPLQTDVGQEGAQQQLPSPDLPPTARSRGTVPAELVALSELISELSQRAKYLGNLLRLLVVAAEDFLERGYTLEFDGTDADGTAISIDRGQTEDHHKSLDASMQLLVFKWNFASFEEALNESIVLQQAIQREFAELPESVVAMLPKINGAPWRSFYLRECLDVFSQWPREIERTEFMLRPSLNVRDLIGVARSRQGRPGFPFVERFIGFHDILQQAVSDLRSLRLDIEDAAPSKIGDSNTPLDSDSTPISKATEATVPRRQIKPKLATLEVIRAIDQGKSIDEIAGELRRSADSIRQIRSRYNRGVYVL